MIQQFYQIQNEILKDIPLTFKRFIYNKINFEQRLIGIVGPRGVGKTTLLLQYIQEHQAPLEMLYVSADNLYFRQQSLFDFVTIFYHQHGGRVLCIDEIHRYPNWNQELKNIYDSFPQLKVVFSGSSSLDLISGSYDLSRRGILYHVAGLSFREFLELQYTIQFPNITLDTVVQDHYTLAQEMSHSGPILKYFKEYLQIGYYPFYQETSDLIEYYQKLKNTIHKIIYVDIADYYSINTENLRVFEEILAFVATTPPTVLNANNLGKTLQKNYRTTLHYLDILVQTSLLRTLGTTHSGSALIRKAKKIFLENTNILQAINFELGRTVNIGTQRELFMLNQLQNAGYVPNYTPKGDMIVQDITLEIGGKNKDRTQIRGLKNSYLAVDDVVIGDKHTIPLYMFGFLY